MSLSLFIMAAMSLLFLGGLYIVNWMVNRRRAKLLVLKARVKAEQASTLPDGIGLRGKTPVPKDRGLPHYAMGLAVALPLVVGALLATFLIKSSSAPATTHKKARSLVYDKDGRRIVTFSVPADAEVGSTLDATETVDSSAVPFLSNYTYYVTQAAKSIIEDVAKPPPPNSVRVVISDNSLETTAKLLDKCTARQALIVRNKTVECIDVKALERLIVKTLDDKRMQERKHLFDHKTLIRPKTVLEPLRQGVAATVPPTEERKPWKDRYAEIFYFLALVLGVLGKFYWDYSEEKATTGQPVPFDAHLIAMSFILACLVYYSIQQGLEKEASKLSLRGVLFAFNNGFMWQTILKSLRRPNSPARRRTKPA